MGKRTGYTTDQQTRRLLKEKKPGKSLPTLAVPGTGRAASRRRKRAGRRKES